MKTINGITIFDKGEKFVLPADWPPLPQNVSSPFGFKLVSVGDKNVWQASAESDFRTLLTRRGVLERTIEFAIKIKANLPLCSVSNGECSGSCAGSSQSCRGTLDENYKAVYCWCE
jgi:hypothetical protein